jgi:L-seryl-tRNA(Ser) seleniumtransferase
VSKTISSKQSLLRSLPSVDQLLRTFSGSCAEELGAERLKSFARCVIDEMRVELQARTAEESGSISSEALLVEAVQRLEVLCTSDSRSALRRVINATGVILHTNLGRAPLSENARRAVAEAAGYCTLEYDVLAGSRGHRGERVEQLLQQLTAAEDALVVNNCASAALLILTAFARDGETIVSRGELVEIGGDFRVPDVLANSGTKMIEVGTTNRTKLEDYSRAINERTRLIMRIHPSNYRIVGFTASPSLADLASLAHNANLLLYEDAGSGVLEDLSEFGLRDEPIIRESVLAEADVISFSGDKLLGSAQAGIIVGKAEIVGRLRRHSLYRALRADKLRLAALEATLEAHSRGTATLEIPTLRMLATSVEEIEVRALAIIDSLRSIQKLKLDLVQGESAVGGGSGPNIHPATLLISLEHTQLTANDIESRLRNYSTPIIGRITDDKVLLDMRTVAPSEDAELVRGLQSAFAK